MSFHFLRSTHQTHRLRTNDVPARRIRSRWLWVELLENRLVPSANSDFASQVYLDLLHRSADAGGLTYWTGQLDQGLDRTAMVQTLESTAEYRAIEVQTAFQLLLNRSADASGVTFFTNFLNGGGTVEQMDSNIGGSPEYFQRQGGSTNPGFLNSLYEDAFKREIDASGQSFFGQQLATGSSRQDVAFEIFTSGEYRTDLVQSYYTTFLHRSADSTGLAHFVGLLQQGVRDEVVIADLVGSSEYFNRITPPAPSTPDLTASSDTGSSNSDNVTSDKTPTFTGTAESGTTVNVYDGGTLLGPTPADVNGSWTFTTGVLSDGSHSITATATNSGQASSPHSAALVIVIDTVAPVISNVLVVPSSISPNGDGTQDSTNLSYTLSEDAVVTVTVKDAGGNIVKTLVSGLPQSHGGHNVGWDGTNTGGVAVADGNYTLTIAATDAAGNVAAPQTAVVTVDTSAPTAPSTPALDPASDSGVIGDNITKVTTPTFTGTAEAGSTVTIYSGGTPVGAVSANIAGNYSVITSVLADGTHHITATATDAAGNASAASGAVTVVIDHTAPVISNVSATPPAISPNGNPLQGSTVIGYTLSEAARVTVVVKDANNNPVKTLLLNSAQSSGAQNVAWDGTNTNGDIVADGVYTFTIEATDVAGNAAAQKSGTVTVDTTAPTAPSTPALDPASDSGVKGDNITNVTMPMFIGTAEPGSMVSLYDVTNGQLALNSGAADANGNYSITPIFALANGTHKIAATATDAAGNTSPLSGVLTIVIDPNAP